MSPPDGVSPVIRFRNPDAGTVAWDDRRQGPHRVRQRASSTTSSRALATARRRTTSASWSTISTCASRTSIRGDDHVNNTPRQINIFARARRRAAGVRARADRARRGRRTSFPSATAPSASWSTRRRATCPTPCSISSRASAGPTATTKSSRRDELVEWFDLAGISPAPSRFDPEQAQLGQPGAHEAHAGCRARPATRAVSRARRARSRRAGPTPARWRRCCAIARKRWSRWPTQARYFYATPQVDPGKLAEQITPADRAALRLKLCSNEFATHRLDARSDRCGDEGRCAARRPEAAAAHDADARAGRRHDPHAGDRRGARLLGASERLRACGTASRDEAQLPQ